ILNMTAGDRMYLPIEAYILPIGITEDVGMDERVIERCVKGRHLIRGSTLYLNAIQTCIPCSNGIVSDCREIEIGILGSQVSLSIGKADKGNADLSMDHLVRTRIEGHEGTALRTAGRSRAVVDSSPIPRAIASKRAIKLGDKVEGIMIATAANRACIEASYFIT